MRSTTLALGTVALCASVVLGADHRDGSIAQDQPADIADTYAFVSPNDSTKVVLAMTVNGHTVPGVATVFSTDVLYQFKIDNDGDFVEDLVIQATFEGLSGPDQTVVLYGPDEPRKTGSVNKLLKTKGKKATTVFRGSANAVVLDASSVVPGMRVFAGRTDDPFFVDLIYVRSLIGVIPPIGREPGLDQFAGFNVSTLAIEVPAALLTGEGNTIRVWSTTSRFQKTARSSKKDDKNGGSFIQVDREGLPAINAVLIPAPLRTEYNRGSPRDDEQYKDEVRASIQALGQSAETAAALADALLPDVLTLDVTNNSGFLNGRRPQDDVIDAVLGLLTGGAVTTDGVDSNDPRGEDITPDGFLSVFPFFAPEHRPSAAIPSRD